MKRQLASAWERPSECESSPPARWCLSARSSASRMVTFLTVLNFYAITATVTATYYFDDGTEPLAMGIVVPPSGRATLSSDDVPPGKRFGVVLSCQCQIVAQE